MAKKEFTRFTFWVSEDLLSRYDVLEANVVLREGRRRHGIRKALFNEVFAAGLGILEEDVSHSGHRLPIDSSHPHSSEARPIGAAHQEFPQAVRTPATPSDAAATTSSTPGEHQADLDRDLEGHVRLSAQEKDLEPQATRVARAPGPDIGDLEHISGVLDEILGDVGISNEGKEIRRRLAKLGASGI